MAIFAQTYKSVDSQITELEQQLQQLQDYRQQLQTADETAKSSLKALSEAMGNLKPEHAEEVKREITRYLGLDNLPATDSTCNGNDSSDNGASSESEGAEGNDNDRKPVSIFTQVGNDSTDSAPDSSENGKSEQSEAATDSTSTESTTSTTESGDNGKSEQSEGSDASGEDEVIRHEFFTDDLIQVEDAKHEYNGRVCKVRKLLKDGYWCQLEPRTDEQGSETVDLKLTPSQIKAYKLPTQSEAESIGSGVFPEFSVNQRVNVRQQGNEFKQGTITKINTDGTARVKLDNYPNSISVAFKDMQALKKSTPAKSSG